MCCSGDAVLVTMGNGEAVGGGKGRGKGVAAAMPCLGRRSPTAAWSSEVVWREGKGCAHILVLVLFTDQRRRNMGVDKCGM